MILVCGETLFDVFEIASSGDEKSEDEFLLRAVAGGSPFNVAVGLARLGRDASLSTTVGCDSLGQKALNALGKEGVNTDFVRRSGTTPLALVDIGVNGIPSYNFSGLEQAIYYPDEKRLSDVAIEAIHIGSLSIVSYSSADQLLALVRERSGDGFISLDPNVRLNANSDVDRWRQKIDAFRQYAHLIKVSEEDLLTAYGPAVNPASIAEDWLAGCTQMVVVTQGSEGASLYSKQGKATVPGVPVKTADTVGAGDSFQSALLCWLDERGFLSPNALSALSADEIHDMGRFAVLASSLTCSRNGPNLPHRREVQGVI